MRARRFCPTANPHSDRMFRHLPKLWPRSIFGASPVVATLVPVVRPQGVWLEWSLGATLTPPWLSLTLAFRVGSSVVGEVELTRAVGRTAATLSWVARSAAQPQCFGVALLLERRLLPP